jgi:hypothetical protein
MPAQRIFGFARSAKIDLVLNPGADDVMRDRDRGRCGEPLWMFAHQHRFDLIFGKPAGVLKFLAVDHNLVRHCFGVTADHQRGRKRPGLRGEIDHAAADNAGLFASFPMHCVFDRFARLDETREA